MYKHSLSQNIGSVSHGTMRPEDLIPCFIDTIRDQKRVSWKHRAILRTIEKNARSKNYFESERASYDLETLFDLLNEYAPEGFYFGSHPGDGSDYGFWLSEEFLSDFDGPKLDDSSKLARDFYGLYLIVSDHGNASLFERTRNHRTIEHWSVV